MKKLYLFFLLVCTAATSYSQTAVSYAFTTTTGTYASISGTGTASTILCDDCVQTSIPLGFSFSFCGISYTSASASSNAFLSLANYGFSLASNPVTNIPGAGFLMPFWGDLTGAAILGNVPGAYYSTTGSSPNRVFTFEWKDFDRSGTGCGPCNGNFQVKLYETSNVIEFVYGSSGLIGTACAIGIANSTTDWQSLDGSGAAPVVSTSTFTNNIASAPSNGQIYRWTPGCWNTPTPGTVSASVSSGCVSYSSNLSLSGSSSGTPGIIYQWQSSPDGSAWSNVTGATNSTYTASVTGNIYYRCNLICANTSTNAYTPGLELFINEPAPISGPDTVCVGSTITLADASPGGTWSSGSASLATVSAGGVVSGVSSGSVTITYTLSGCPATKAIHVDPCIINGVKTLPNNVVTGLQVYPNPNTGTFAINVSSVSNEQANIIISDLSGRQLKKFATITNNIMELRLNLPPGAYVVIASTSKGKYVTKLMIE